MENNKKYKLTNVHNFVTLVETKKNRVIVVDGFSNGDAGSIRDFMKFVTKMAKANEPIKIEEITNTEMNIETADCFGLTVSDYFRIWLNDQKEFWQQLNNDMVEHTEQLNAAVKAIKILFK